jgi:hypothetical protein
MAKRETLEEVARREGDAAKETARAEAERRESAERLAKEMPARFFQLAAELREAVRRFNVASEPGGRLIWRESPSLATRDLGSQSDLSLSFGRAQVTVELSLTAMSRSGRPDAFVIQGGGRLGARAFQLRVDGNFSQGKVRYRASVDFRRLECPIEELGERLVLAAVKGSLTPLEAA